MLRYVLAAAFLFGLYQYWDGRAQSHPPGQVAPAEPLQRALSRLPALEKPGYSIEPLARFEIEARVLGKEIYRLDREAGLAPVDLALGWGPMSDSAVLDSISISQSGRFYFWRVEEFPIPQHEITRHSANMHMIPASGAVERRLRALRPGQVVDISGYLVEARAADGWRWRSSLSREDSGQGACELVWVEDLAVR